MRHQKEDREVLLMSETRDVDWPTVLGDRRMWRLLLAQLHPDAGGDHELFLFACAVKKETCGEKRLGSKPAHNDSAQRANRPAERFLHRWQDAMSCWALHNRTALKTFECKAASPGGWR
jgi:hypothetical protein